MKKVLWNDLSWIKVGDRVRLIDTKYGRKPGERSFGEGTGDDNTVWVLFGAIGIVKRLSEGYPAHRCRDHHLSPECTCGEDGPPGIVGELEAWASVDWETAIPGKTISSKSIRKVGEGVDWERVE